MSGCSASIMRTRSRPSSSSSTIIVRILGKSMLVCRRAVEGVIGNGQRGARATLRPIAKFELMLVAVEMAQSGACRRQADALAEPVVRQAAPIIRHGALQYIARARDLHRDMPASSRVLKAMPD